MTTRVIRLRGSEGDAASERELRLEEFVAPFTIGAAADLRVADAQCLPVHARAYFDGLTLFVRSVEAGHPIVVNNSGVGVSWRAVPCPAVIQIGRAELVYEEKVAQVPVPARITGSAVQTLVWEVSRPPLSRVGLPVPPDVVTVVGPLPTLSAIPSLTPAAAVERPPDAARFQGTTQIFELPLARAQDTNGSTAPVELGVSEAPRSSVRAKLGAIARRAGMRAKSEYGRTPRSSRIALAVIPIFAWAGLTQGSPAVHPAAERSAARPSALAGSVSTARPPLPPSGGPLSAAPAAPLPAPVASSSVLANGKSNTKAPPVRSLEAQAVDAAARGAVKEALALYSELAKQNPARPEFQVATRVLTTKAREMALKP